MLYVVGVGPGKKEGLTIEADLALSQSEIIVGYNVYIDIVKEFYPEKEFFASGMGTEKSRCLKALEFANEGRTVSLISSGDACIYGMASLVYELAENFPNVKIKIIAGITAALSGSALIGSPLTNDFVVISLSDILTPAETIRKRLLAAVTGDFVIVIYNPQSKSRKDSLKNACKLLLSKISGETICAIAKNIGRKNESYKIITLKELLNTECDMFTTVFIGNSKTKIINNKMIVPRGYKNV